MTSDPPLPRMVRPRPHYPVVRRAADTLQFGLLPGSAVEVAGLSPPLQHLLLELAGSWRVDELLARAAVLGAEEGEARALLVDLHAAGVLLDAGAHARLVEARRMANVLVSGEGPLVTQVASGLAAAGVSRLNVAAEGVVEAEEVGFSAARGSSRVKATREAVRRAAPGVRVAAGAPRRHPDLAVLVGLLWPGPERHPMPRSREVPQLLVQVADGIGLVGPLVFPRRSTCPRCMDLHRATDDPCWPTVAAGLAGRIGSASAATTAATAGLAVEQALLALDSLVAAGEPPPTLDAVLELDPRGGALRRRRWAPHPECGCGAARTRRAADVAEPPDEAALRRPADGGTDTPRAACEVMPVR